MQNFIRRFLLALFFVVLSVPAMAQRSAPADTALREGAEAAQRGDYATARRVLGPIVSHPHAAFIMGIMELNGWGGPANRDSAARLFSYGAAQRHPGAMFNLGYLHDRGWGVGRDGGMAQELYIGALITGDAMVKNNLAYLWARQGGQLEQALCLSAETLAVDPNNMVFLDTYGFILLQMNQAARAEAYFRKALRSAPDHPTLHEHLGDVAAMTGKGNASESWRRALSNPLDERQRARLAAKLGGASPPYDLDAHSSFVLRDAGLPKECGVPAV